jgi:hypothetical protein
MRRLVLALTGMAGCGFDHGVFSGQQDAGPSDTVAIDAALSDGNSVTQDAMPDAMMTLDTDADGVVNTSDNCPTVANANQRNHDSDAKGDACDKCPHLASTADPDGDSDGVGDACDPRPTMAGDSIVFWEGFYDATSITTWTAGGNGTWAVANGVLTQSSSTGSTTTHTLRPPITVARAAVTSHARAIAFGTSFSDFDTPHASVTAGVDQDHSYWCALVNNGANGDQLYATNQINGNWSTPSTNWTGTWAANSEVRLTVSQVGNQSQCTGVQGATTRSVAGNLGIPNGSVQVGTRSASISFDYLFVVAIGN